MTYLVIESQIITEPLHCARNVLMQILLLAKFESLASRQVNIFLWWPGDAIAGRVAVESAIAGCSIGRRCGRVRSISSGLHPVWQSRLNAA